MPRGAEKYGAWFDHAAADAAVAFFRRYLRHTEAEWWGKPFQLQPWQEHDIIRPAFGWKREDGTRLYRTVWLEIPRKNGKTELAAGIALLLLVADGEMGGQVYSMAVNADQAKIVFKKAGVMVGLSEELSRSAEVFKTSIYVPQLMAAFQPLSSSPGSKHGFSPSGAVADELHEWPDGELHDVVHKGTAARRQPLEVLITTAGQYGSGYGWEMHEYAVKVRDGVIEDPTFLAVIYAADPDDDWTDPKVWAKANPNLGVSVKEEYLATECAKAKGNPRQENNFRRYHLNQWTAQETRWLPMADWDACNICPVRLEDLAGRRCWGGLDLSAVNDLSALALVAARDEGGWDVWWRFWLPKAGLAERIRRDRVPFDQWIRDGWIVPTEGNVVDYDVIREQISGVRPDGSYAPHGTAIAEIVDLQELAIDRWNSTQITTQMTGDGITVVPFGQGYGSMSAPSKELERLVLAHELNHGGNPVARWMASCVSVQEDGADNIKPVKPDRRKSSARIDGIVAAIMALGRAMVDDGEREGNLDDFLSNPVMVI